MAILRRTDEREKETQFWNAVSYWSNSRWCIPQHKFRFRHTSSSWILHAHVHFSCTFYRENSLIARGNPHYDYLIRRMQLTDLSGMSIDQAATTYASFFNCGDLASKPFFSNPYVQDLLKIGTASAISAQTIAHSSSPSPVATSSSTGAFWSSMPASSEPATDVCANPTCTTPVNVFDFRCFKCRNRFCSSCKGTKITCPSCS